MDGYRSVHELPGGTKLSLTMKGCHEKLSEAKTSGHQKWNETANYHCFGDLVAVSLQLCAHRRHHVVVHQGQPALQVVPEEHHPNWG